MSSNLFSYIKTHVPILDVIGEYTTLKKAGSYWKGSCPFHHEKTGSFTVSPHKEIFYCFGCHVHGDVINFIEKIENCTAKEATKILAVRYSLDISSHEYTTLGNNPALADKKDFYFDICRLVADWCHKQWLKYKPIQDYCAQRGITHESCLAFELGYFPGGFASVAQCLSSAQKNNVMPSDLINAGILSQGKTVLYSPFEERLIFPIKDHLGRYCGFGGRIFRDQDTRAKYYNSRENDYFAKGSLLYGFDRAKKKIQETKTVIMVEGYLDCIAMVQSGFQATIAILGTACTQSHLRQLSRYASRLYILYDSDTAGANAALRLAEICWQASIEPFILTLPATNDPASFCCTGGNMEAVIQGAKDIFLFYIESLGSDFNKKSLQEKLHTIERFLDVICSIDSKLKQDILLHQIASYCCVSYDALRQELDKKGGGKAFAQDPPQDLVCPETKLPLLSLVEKKLLSAIVNNNMLMTGGVATFLLECVSPPYKNILEILRDLSRNNTQSVAFTVLYDHLTDEQRQEVSHCVLECETEVSMPDFESLFHQFKKLQWKNLVREIQIKINKAENNNDSVVVQQLIQELLTLKKRLIHS